MNSSQERVSEILLLAVDSRSSRIVFHFLRGQGYSVKVILEEPVGKITFLKKRLKKLGWWRVAGQVFFMLLVRPWLALTSGKRIDHLLRQFQLDDQDIPSDVITRVSSVNDLNTSFFPADIHAVVVHGTRILNANVLALFNAPVLNIHAGITPAYRGVHGMYWALCKNDPERTGVTVHRVDAGIDTGMILSQKILVPAPMDQFETYPYLQLAEGLGLLADVLTHFPEGIPVKDRGQLWSHPTLGQYLYYRFTRGVK